MNSSTLLQCLVESGLKEKDIIWAATMANAVKRMDRMSAIRDTLLIQMVIVPASQKIFFYKKDLIGKPDGSHFLAIDFSDMQAVKTELERKTTPKP